jgi:hypothetical protein
MKDSMKLFVWFWKESKKFTGYSWPRLLICGILPCLRFFKLTLEDKRRGQEEGEDELLG